MGTAATSQLQAPWFGPKLGLRSVQNFTCLYVYESFFWFVSFLPLPKQAMRQTEYAKLSRSLNDCLEVFEHGTL